MLPPPTWAQDKLIDALLGSAVVSIDPQRRVVGTGRGRFLEYDRLILATGIHNFIPPIEGWGISGGFACVTLTTHWACGTTPGTTNTSMPWSWAVACWGWERPMPWAGHQTHEGTVPVTQLKVVGVDLFSLGDFDGVEGDEVICLMEAEDRRYRHWSCGSASSLERSYLVIPSKPQTSSQHPKTSGTSPQ